MAFRMIRTDGAGRSASPRYFALMFGGAIVAIALVWWLISAMSAPAADAANSTLRTVGAGDIRTAWQQASPAFRANSPEPLWERYVANHALTTFRGARWNDVSIRNDVAQLAGSVTTGRGTFPADIAMRKEGGAWRLYALNIHDDIKTSGVPD